MSSSSAILKNHSIFMTTSSSSSTSMSKTSSSSIIIIRNSDHSVVIDDDSMNPFGSDDHDSLVLSRVLHDHGHVHHHHHPLLSAVAVKKDVNLSSTSSIEVIKREGRKTSSLLHPTTTLDQYCESPSFLASHHLVGTSDEDEPSHDGVADGRNSRMSTDPSDPDLMFSCSASLRDVVVTPTSIMCPGDSVMTVDDVVCSSSSTLVVVPSSTSSSIITSSSVKSENGRKIGHGYHNSMIVDDLVDEGVDGVDDVEDHECDADEDDDVGGSLGHHPVLRIKSEKASSLDSLDDNDVILKDVPFTHYSNKSMGNASSGIKMEKSLSPSIQNGGINGHPVIQNGGINGHPVKATIHSPLILSQLNSHTPLPIQSVPIRVSSSSLASKLAPTTVLPSSHSTTNSSSSSVVVTSSPTVVPAANGQPRTAIISPGSLQLQQLLSASGTTISQPTTTVTAIATTSTAGMAGMAGSQQPLDIKILPAGIIQLASNLAVFPQQQQNGVKQQQQIALQLVREDGTSIILPLAVGSKAVTTAAGNGQQTATVLISTAPTGGQEMVLNTTSFIGNGTANRGKGSKGKGQQGSKETTTSTNGNNNSQDSSSTTSESGSSSSHGDRPFKCELCNSTFTRLGNYTRHKKIHSLPTKEDQRFRCDICSKSFIQRCDLARHLHIHRGTEPHRCPQCGKGYIRHSDLVTHQRFHNKEKPFACPHCSKGFCQRGDLNRHLRSIHLQLKPILCSHCHKKFAKEETLLRHINATHRDKFLEGPNNVGNNVAVANSASNNICTSNGVRNN